MDTGLERRLTARTLEDLGELTAPWLEGRITFLPTYTLDTPAAETEGLIAHLAAFNRAGYTTTESQPAVPFDGHDGQRAFVSGFASEATVDAVEAAILGTRLIALVTPTGRDSLPHSRHGDGGRPVLLHRARLFPQRPHRLLHPSCPLAVPALLEARQLEVFDPEWGDDHLLWDTLARALKR